MLLSSHLKPFGIVFVCMFVSSAWESVGTVHRHSEVLQFWYRSVFILVLGTRWTWSIRKSCSLVLRTFPGLLSFLPSSLLSVLLLDIEAPGLVYQSIFPVSYDFVSWFYFLGDSLNIISSPFLEFLVLAVKVLFL